jgi:hypothetical protein
VDVPDVRYTRRGDVAIAYKDLVAGAGLACDDHGEHELKGVPGCWRIYAVLDG